MDRREAIRHVSALLGGAALISAPRLLAALENPATHVGSFTAADIAWLDEIAETIIPETKTPGAKAAQVGTFMAVMVSDCYRAPQQAVFREGMRQIDAATRKLAGKPFMQASPQERLAVLTVFDEEQRGKRPTRAPTARRSGPPPEHFFRMMKELTFLGYFTSEIGCTQALRYVETPGHYSPCVPYVPGTPSWADHA